MNTIETKNTCNCAAVSGNDELFASQVRIGSVQSFDRIPSHHRGRCICRRSRRRRRRRNNSNENNNNKTKKRNRETRDNMIIQEFYCPDFLMFHPDMNMIPWIYQTTKHLLQRNKFPSHIHGGPILLDDDWRTTADTAVFYYRCYLTVCTANRSSSSSSSISSLSSSAAAMVVGVVTTTTTTTTTTSKHENDLDWRDCYLAATICLKLAMKDHGSLSLSFSSSKAVGYDMDHIQAIFQAFEDDVLLNRIRVAAENKTAEGDDIPSSLDRMMRVGFSILHHITEWRRRRPQSWRHHCDGGSSGDDGAIGMVRILVDLLVTGGDVSRIDGYEILELSQEQCRWVTSTRQGTAAIMKALLIPNEDGCSSMTSLSLSISVVAFCCVMNTLKGMLLDHVGYDLAAQLAIDCHDITFCAVLDSFHHTTDMCGKIITTVASMTTRTDNPDSDLNSPLDYRYFENDNDIAMLIDEDHELNNDEEVDWDFFGSAT